MKESLPLALLVGNKKKKNWGFRAWRHAKKVWEREKERNETRGKNCTTVCPQFSRVEEDVVWNSLKWISGIPESRETDDVSSDSEAEEAAEWSLKDLYKGLVPKELITSWKTLFKTTKFIATYMVTKFVTDVEEFGRTGIWNKRCEATVAWEKSIGITAMSKRARGHSGAEGRPSSGSDFSDLTRRQVLWPDVLESRKKADERVFKHFMGYTRLDIMERPQGLKTNLLTLDQID
jgi:hypothetical protein